MSEQLLEYASAAATIVAELVDDFAQTKPPRYNLEVFDPERFNV